MTKYFIFVIIKIIYRTLFVNANEEEYAINLSAVKTVKILQLIASSTTPLGISQISQMLGYPKSSVFDIVEALLSEQMLEYYNIENKTLTVGAAAYHIGCVYTRRMDLLRFAHPFLEKISRQTGDNCYLAIEKNHKLLYVDYTEGYYPIRSACRIGDQNELYCTGLGKAILAAMSQEELDDYFSQPVVPHTNATILHTEQWKKELLQIRLQGYAVDRGEDIDLLRCVASPIFNANGQAVAAISVSMIYGRFTEQKKAQCIESITKAALLLSHRLGYQRQTLYDTKGMKSYDE